jgi:hypothetical protein
MSSAEETNTYDLLQELRKACTSKGFVVTSALDAITPRHRTNPRLMEALQFAADFVTEATGFYPRQCKWSKDFVPRLDHYAAYTDLLFSSALLYAQERDYYSGAPLTWESRTLSDPWMFSSVCSAILAFRAIADEPGYRTALHRLEEPSTLRGYLALAPDFLGSRLIPIALRKRLGKHALSFVYNRDSQHVYDAMPDSEFSYAVDGDGYAYPKSLTALFSYRITDARRLEILHASVGCRVDLAIKLYGSPTKDLP